MTLQDPLDGGIALWRVGEEGAEEPDELLRRKVEQEAIVEQEHEVGLDVIREGQVSLE